MSTQNTNYHIALGTSSTGSRFGVLDALQPAAPRMVPFSTSAGETAVGRQSPSVSEIERAVSAHIRAMRTLGHVTANSADIARALSLPLTSVEKALAGLKGQGVKVRSR